MPKLERIKNGIRNAMTIDVYRYLYMYDLSLPVYCLYEVEPII